VGRPINDLRAVGFVLGPLAAVDGVPLPFPGR